MAREKRVLAIYVDDISPASCKGNLGPMDKIIIFSEGKDIQEMDVFEDRTVICDCKLEDTEKVKKTIQKLASGKNDKIYLIGPVMGRYYEDLLPLANYCGGIGKNATFGVSRVKVYKKDTQQSMFDANGVADSMVDEVAESAATQMETVEEQNKKNAEEKMKRKTPARKKPPEKEIDSTSGKKSPEKKEENKTPAMSDAEVNLQKLEAKVFGSPKQNTTFKSITSPLQDAKAELSFYMRKRYKEHIRLQVSIELSDQQVFDFSTLILKTEQPEEFLESWNASEPTANIKMGLKAYMFLKGEAEFFNRMCAFMYEDDVWDY